MSFFDELVKRNTYPIVFIGSGMSKRYLNNCPSWLDLLQQFWVELTQDDFYSYLSEIKEKLPQHLTENEKNFQVNIKVAKNIHDKFNQAFRKKEVTIPNLNSEDVFLKSIDPFKYALSLKFQSVKLKENIDMEEYELFCDVLVNAKIIVTTNYDTFIEDILSERNNPAKVFIGQKGFFDPYEDWGELYKIHGSVLEPSSIVIDEDDYSSYDKNSILISAKLLSNMIHSPIIFLGYSLTDRNVVKLLTDFSSQIPIEDLRKTANRIVVVEYEEGNTNIDEKNILDRESNISYTHIKTDNYKEIFSKLSKIDEGLSPYEVRKFNGVIKKLVMASGQKGALDSVLVSPVELENIAEQIDQGKPIVLAIGDSKYIFVNPTVTNYMEDYVLEKHEILSDNALRFVANQGAATKNPFIYHYKNLDINNSSLEPWEIDRINDKINNRNQAQISGIKSTINLSHQKTYASLEDILAMDLQLNKKIDLITYNSPNLSFEEFNKYVKEIALPNFVSLYKKRNKKDGNLKSAYRKLFSMWDILKYGEIKK
ncbi:SIR2 family protein [Enterococcus nangangensis]|uniref:SIR2 family protein n=1 Tax=Enterococcus nangangensis TaxID=2559926 RepID=UPI0010F4E9D9|nr:SIR2 family protein [Enterococcus nangangensis]